MTTIDKVNDLKTKGNTALQADKLDEAIQFYTEALALDPSNHILFSNRCAAHTKKGDYVAALADAQKTVEVKPDWAKGYSRLGAALQGLGQIAEARAALKHGLELEPSNEQILEALQSLPADQQQQQQRRAATPAEAAAFMENMRNIVADNFEEQVRGNEVLAGLMEEPEYADMVRKITAGKLDAARPYFNNPMFQLTIQMLAGATTGVRRPASDASSASASASSSSSSSSEAPSAAKKPAMEPEAPPAAPLSAEAQRAAAARERGNALYREKKLDEALAQYREALAAEPTNVSVMLNVAAVHLEQGNAELCITQCREAIDSAREQRADYKLIAKAFFRIGNAQARLGRLGDAIESYQKSLTENRTKEALEALTRVEQQKKQKDEADYINPALGQTAREAGNEAFKAGDWATAVKHYSEAIRRDPTSHLPYSNRGATYMKLGELGLALADTNRCLELDATFIKAWVRKGNILLAMKDYKNALEAFDRGLALDPENVELIEGVQKTLSRSRAGGDAEATARAMADPEIQELMQDPAMAQILKELREDPVAAQRYLQNPAIASKIQKLILAGVVKTR